MKWCWLLIVIAQTLLLVVAFDLSNIQLLEEEQTKRHSPLASYFNEEMTQKGESAKRSAAAYATSPIIRFGKRGHKFFDMPLHYELLTQQMMMDQLIRFGKRASSVGAMSSYGGVDRPLIRFGKRAPLGVASAFSSTPHIRFGKRADDADGLLKQSAGDGGEMDTIGFSRYRRPNPIDSVNELQNIMLRFG